MHLDFEFVSFNVPSGVPQNNHLSTLLFNICINDIFNVIKSSHTFIFVDDVKKIS